jgi:hypothetical protein
MFEAPLGLPIQITTENQQIAEIQFPAWKTMLQNQLTSNFAELVNLWEIDTEKCFGKEVLELAAPHTSASLNCLQVFPLSRSSASSSEPSSRLQQFSESSLVSFPIVLEDEATLEDGSEVISVSFLASTEFAVGFQHLLNFK